MINRVAAESRFIDMERTKLADSGCLDGEVLEICDGFLRDFAAYHDVSMARIAEDYLGFVRDYSQDIRHFSATGKYPFESGKVRALGRVQYDLALIMSTVVSVPRHRLMKKLMEVARGDLGRTAVVGVGPGIELDIIRRCRSASSLEAFDIDLSAFAADRFSGIVHESEFTGGEGHYESIFAIELLEHLAAPFKLISACREALSPGGRLICTTAVNMPQFDHLFNFEDSKFEAEVAALGFDMVEKENLAHDYLGAGFEAKNVFYVLERPVAPGPSVNEEGSE